MISINSGTTFHVSTVERSKNPLPTSSYATSVSNLLKQKFEACSKGDRTLVAGVSLHPFLAAVHLAFDQHYPLSLSPDAVWLCLTQGLALHVNANAEQLRHHFVQDEGKETIEVRRNDFIFCGGLGEL